jgi:hypothetical protein
MIQRKKRHPIMGLFFGLLLGLGLGLMAIIYGIYFVGPLTPWLLVILGVVIGLGMSYVPKLWGRKPPPATMR